MPKIAIVTDSGADMPADVQHREGIKVVPLVVRFGAEVYLDGQFSLDEFWRKAKAGPPYPETSQPSAGMFEEAFAPLVADGYDVLCLVITSQHSGTFNSAHAASQSFPGRVSVFDTLSLSLGQACQVIAAARAAAEGRSMQEIISMLEGIRSRTHMFIGLDTIEYLRRGGRASKVIPVLERVVRALNIKPLLIVVEGELKLLGAARSRQKSIERIREEITKRSPAEMLVMVHTRSGPDATSLAHTLAEQLGFPFESIMIGEAGPALSSHAGPGVVAAAIVQRP